MLVDEHTNHTIEGQLIRPKLIRELYKQLGAPQEEEYGEDIMRHGKYWNRMRGYTTDIEITTERYMKNENRAATNWRVKRPSAIKAQIVEEYVRDGWSCDVQAHNVICNKYVPHPKYKNIWVRFYSSRDCNKYEYVIEVE